MRQGIYARSVKRKLDILLSGTAIVLLSPVLAVTAWQVKKKIGSPVLFTQLRPGKDEKIFKMYKFRTMTDERDENGDLLPDEQRLTEFGKFLRESSLDELPELFNILKGDMSVVGPRPERPELVAEIEKNIPEFSYRLKVKAGLTGYAQVYGKYNTTSYDKLKLDLMYIRKYSLLLDVKLIIMTPKIMLLKESTEGVMPDPDVPTEK